MATVNSLTFGTSNVFDAVKNSQNAVAVNTQVKSPEDIKKEKIKKAAIIGGTVLASVAAVGGIIYGIRKGKLNKVLSENVENLTEQLTEKTNKLAETTSKLTETTEELAVKNIEMGGLSEKLTAVTKALDNKTNKLAEKTSEAEKLARENNIYKNIKNNQLARRVRSAHINKPNINSEDFKGSRDLAYFNLNNKITKNAKIMLHIQEAAQGAEDIENNKKLIGLTKELNKSSRHRKYDVTGAVNLVNNGMGNFAKIVAGRW